MNNNPGLARSYITPWTLRIFNALPGNPAGIGVAFTIILLFVFTAGRIFFDGAAGSTPGNLRLAIIHILLTGYTASAYAYLLKATSKATQDLVPILENAPQRQKFVDQVGKHLWWGLLLAGFVGILVDVYATNSTTIGSNPWDWRQNNYDSLWMRVLGPCFAWWISCLFYVLVVESARLSKLSESIASLDILNLLPYQPLIRQGLTNALLVVGMSSVLSLMLLEPGFALLMIQLLVVFAIFAWVGLMLPLRGIRKKIGLAKAQELDWCRQALINARNALKSDAGHQQSIVEIAAYKAVIDGIRNWPFDSPTLTRFALYLLIPVTSLFGGALVERGFDLFLP